MAEGLAPILGRERETAQIAGFIGSVLDRPGAMLIEGVAGIGKSTIWREGLEAAEREGMTVLSTRPVESETAFSYAALADLFGGSLDVASGDLPAPQRRAIQIALLRAEPDGPPPDQQAVSMATLGLLRSIAGSAPTLVAVDDVHWIDRPTARVLGYVIHRLADEPVVILASARTGLAIPSELARALRDVSLERLIVGPMERRPLGAVVRARVAPDLPRPFVARLCDASGGNPFYALEIARAITREGAHLDPSEPFPIPDDVQELLRRRLDALPATSAEPLLVIAASAKPTEELVLAASTREDRVLAGLARAEAADVIRRGAGEIRFTHPLLGSAVYSSATPATKRALHGRLAQLVDDTEERARHLALAATGPDPRVAGVLEKAAYQARARGAPQAAAELCELARRLTPDDDAHALRRRSLQAAEYHFDAGDAPRAQALLRATADTSPPGRERAEILYRLSSMSWMNLERGVREPLERALPEADGDHEVLAGIEVDLAWVDMYQADLARAWDHAQRALTHAREIQDPATRGDALATFGMVEFLSGRPAEPFMGQAMALQDIGMEGGTWTEASVYTTPRSILGLQLMWAGRLDEARTELELELALYERNAMYTVRQEVLCYLAELECRAGNWQLAAGYAAEAMETVIESGQTATQSHVVLFNQALAAAHLGEVDPTRAMASEGIERGIENDDPFNTNWNLAVLGFLELSLGAHQAAVEHLRPVVGFLDRMAPAEPGVIPCVPDLIEACVSIGELAEARDRTARLVERGQARDRPWARATGARCEGLVAAAAGDLESARSALERALLEHEQVSQPFERARSLLVKGEIERRAKQKRFARADLGSALSIFESLGAPLWADRARSALARVSGRATQPGELTPTERKVVALAADGRTNKEIADALFLSVKTVEANLSRVYHKMGIRSRRQLPRAVEVLEGGPAAQQTER